MPPVFGPTSPSPIRLKSRAGASATARSPSQTASSESSSPVRRSSTTALASPSPKRPSTKISLSAACACSDVSATVTPLPAARPSALITTPAPGEPGLVRQLAHGVQPLLQRPHARPARGRHPGLLPSRPSRTPSSPPAKPRPRLVRRRAAARGERVDQSGNERHLRPDDGEVDILALDRGHQPVDVVHRDVQHARVVGDARVARRAQQLRPLRRARQRAHDRVLAPARADDQNLHVRATQ